jgi:hypothetical protein
MRFFLGAVCGVLITVLAVFFADALTATNDPAGNPPERIVNWDLAGKRLAASLDALREEVHDLTR